MAGLAAPLAALAAGPAPVDLLSLGNFAILSKTGITDTGSHASVVTGNIGASPITAAAMNGVFCSEMTGTIYGVDAAYVGSGDQTCFAGNPPSSNKTLADDAVLDMGTAYADAAGRMLPDGTNLYTGNIGGKNFSPGLYKWTTDVTIPTDVTLTGGANDVWIFQIAGNLSVPSGADVPSGIKVVLAGGARAANVFWQVGGTTGATLGTYATFNGNILSAKQIIMQTGAVLNGRALAQTQVTLDAAVVSVPTAALSGPVFIDANGNRILDAGEQFFTTIKAAVAAAAAGDTVFVTAGTYVEAGQIVIDKNLSIVGESSTAVTIMTDGDTGASGDGKGWFLVNAGKTFDISGVTLNGTGHRMYQAIRYNGSGTVNGVRFSNIAYEKNGPEYNGAGVRIGSSGNVDVTDSVFSNMGRVGVLAEGGTGSFSGNTYTGKGAGNWLDYAFDIEFGSHVTISNNAISHNRGIATSDGSTSSGVSVWDDAGTQATLTGNTFTDDTAGVAVAVASGGTDPVVTIGAGNVFNGGDVGVDIQSAGANGSPTVAITGSTFTGNTTGVNVPAGMTASNVAVHASTFTGNGTGIVNAGLGTVDAANDWWGDASGPAVASNPSGTGDPVSSLVLYDPWYLNALNTPAPAQEAARVGTINVVKRVINDNGGTKTIADFPLFVNGVPVSSGVSYDFAAPADAYAVTETGDAAYERTFSGDCDVDGRVNLNPGDNKFCIVTNDDIGAPVVVPPVPPIIDVVKIPSPLDLPAGPGAVTYTYTVSNIGIVAMTDVTLIGDTCSPIVLVSGDMDGDAALDVNETWTYTCTTTLAQTSTNTVVAVGWANGLSATDIASATVVVGAPIVPPLIHVTQVPNPLTLSTGGGTVIYTMKVTNPGVVPLGNVLIADDKCGPVNFASGDANENSKLDVNETWTYTCASNLAKTTTDTVTASGEANGLTARDFAIVTVVVGQLDAGLVSRLSGKILLQVQSHGEAWYVNPEDGKRYYMKDGTAAFAMMRQFALGITDKDLSGIRVSGSGGTGTSEIASRLKGRILLQVERQGQAWYVNTVDGLRYFMGTPQDAYDLMSTLALGITDHDLEKIPIGTLE